MSKLKTSYSPLNIAEESPVISSIIVGATLCTGAYGLYSHVTSGFVSKYALIIAIIIIVVMIFMSYFYRKPLNTIRNDTDGKNSNLITSPAYGTVYEILPVVKNDHQYTHISIFLSPADVHFQYFPTNATFVKTTYDATGKFSLAYEMNKSNENEKSITEIKTKNGDSIFITQIAGFLVRRINTKKFKEGADIKAGQELGMIKFGSRVDVEIPSEYKILIKEGEYLYGPETIIARIEDSMN